MVRVLVLFTSVVYFNLIFPELIDNVANLSFYFISYSIFIFFKVKYASTLLSVLKIAYRIDTCT